MNTTGHVNPFGGSRELPPKRTVNWIIYKESVVYLSSSQICKILICNRCISYHALSVLSINANKKTYNDSPCLFITPFSCCSFTSLLFLVNRMSLNSFLLNVDGIGGWCLLTPLPFDNDGRVSSWSMFDGQGASEVDGQAATEVDRQGADEMAGQGAAEID